MVFVFDMERQLDFYICVCVYVRALVEVCSFVIHKRANGVMFNNEEWYNFVYTDVYVNFEPKL